MQTLAAVEAVRSPECPSCTLAGPDPGRFCARCGASGFGARLVDGRYAIESELGRVARVVVVSGRVGPADRWRFSLLGVNDFVAKPTDLKELVETISGVAERAGWREQARAESAFGAGWGQRSCSRAQGGEGRSNAPARVTLVARADRRQTRSMPLALGQLVFAAAGPNDEP